VVRIRLPAANASHPGGALTGPIGLHGGGEYVDGDEPFIDALLRAAAGVAAIRSGARPTPSGDDADDPEALTDDVRGHGAGTTTRAIRIVLLPTAAGRGRPDLAVKTGRAAFERRAATAGLAATIEVARIVDAASADDPRAAEPLHLADLIHLPGGDPDLVPAILGGSQALGALEAAWRRGAVVAGASAGAMALAEWTWTPNGGTRGLGFVRGLAVVPHYDDVRRTRWQQSLDALAPGGIGYLGLDERTGVLSTAGEAGWRVAGRGAAYWFARGATEPRIGRDGDLVRLVS